MEPTTLTILHFNDVYTIEESKNEPVGGIARFKTALNQFKDLNPLTLFSGDCFSPSTLTNVTKGTHMIYPLNSFGIDVACLGNHEFDLYLDVLKDNISKCNFPWLLSNVTDPDTKEPLGGGKAYYTLIKNKIKIGFMGLAEYDWFNLLPLTPDELVYEDFVECARRMTKFLREEEKCDIVIALTHMRNHNDEKLAQEFEDIDLILGGHDHVDVQELVNGTYFIKSGCEFREFSKITLNILDSQQIEKLQKNDPEKLYKNKFTITVDHVQVSKRYQPDPDMQQHVDEYYQILKDKMEVNLGYNAIDLETSFKKIRVSEQNLPNFVADLVRSASGTDIMMLNTGTIRSDCVIPEGILRLKEIYDMFPFQNLIIKLKLTGEQLYRALENSVSKYPIFEGRFPAISGVKFTFNAKADAGKRIQQESIYIENRGPLDLKEYYTIAVRDYLARGKDGFEAFQEAEMLNSENTAEELRFIFIRFFELAHNTQILNIIENELKGGKKIADQLNQIAQTQNLNVQQRLLQQCHHLIAGIKYVNDQPVIVIKPEINKRINIIE